MKTVRLIIICLTVILVAWFKYVIPVLDRAAEREIQWDFHLRGIRPYPPPPSVTEPEARRL